MPRKKKIPMSDPFPLILAEPRWSWQKRLVITERFMPLNSRARGLTKCFHAIQGISDIFLILQKSEKGIINKVPIEQLRGGIWQENAMNQTRRNGVGYQVTNPFSSKNI